MIDLTKYLSRTLNKERSDKKISEHEIALALANAILLGYTELGSILPTQAETASNLNISQSVVKRAWKILREDYKLIAASRGVGTRVITDLSLHQRKLLESRILSSSKPVRKRYFEKECINEFDQIFEREFSIASSYYNKMDYEEYKLKELPGLISAFAQMMTIKKSYTFTDAEVYYTDDYEELITYCCEEFSRPKSTIVLLDQASGGIHTTIVAARRKVHYILKKEGESVLQELKLLCQSQNSPAEMVYVGSTAPFPLLYYRDEMFWQQLLDLQKLYHFKILLDERLPNLIEVPNLFKWISPANNTSIISINAISVHRKLNLATIFLGGSDDVKRIKKRLKSRRKLIYPVLNHLLLDILKGNKLNEIEQQIIKRIKSVISAVKKMLLASELFVDEYIVKQQAYFFYLELRSGEVLPNLYKKLKLEGIIIMNPKTYHLGPEFNNGFLLSVAHYLDTQEVLQDLAEVLRYVKIIRKH